MKAILISIKPKYVADILNHKKTIEVRKSMPKCDLPIDVYIYCTKDKSLIYTDGTDGKGGYVDYKYYESYKGDLNDIGGGKVVAKFTLNKVEEISYLYRSDFTSVYTDTLDTEELEKQACLTRQEIRKYLLGNIGYAWHISNLEIFDKPKELSEFNHYGCKQYNNDVCKVYGERGHLYTNCFFHLTKAPQSMCYVESEK